LRETGISWQVDHLLFGVKKDNGSFHALQKFFLDAMIFTEKLNSFRKEKIMIKIALCDDDSVFLDNVSLQINATLRSMSVSASIAAFTKSSVMTASVEDGERFDIYILDVEMPELDRFQTAEKIRVFQPNAVLIFLTSHIEFAAEGYKVEAIRYIPKLNIETVFLEAIEKAVNIA
jgi:DNA-binding LytR/AlgR family response regulator